MGTKRAGGRTERLTEADRSFTQWRRTRTRRERIPERLWRMAVDAAMVGGVSGTARRLRLNPTQLKERLQASLQQATPDEQPRFVQWPFMQGAALPECVLEAEAPCGTKLRIHLKAAATQQVATLGRMLWRDEG
jgi:hypothetical protein